MRLDELDDEERDLSMREVLDLTILDMVLDLCVDPRDSNERKAATRRALVIAHHLWTAGRTP